MGLPSEIFSPWAVPGNDGEIANGPVCAQCALSVIDRNGGTLPDDKTRLMTQVRPRFFSATQYFVILKRCWRGYFVQHPLVYIPQLNV